MSKNNRNNTNFPVVVFNQLKEANWSDNYSFLKYYQNITKHYVCDVMQRENQKGVIIKHPMGSGKSLLAMSIAIDLLEKLNPIVLLTKSLQGNMVETIHKYIDMRGKVEPDYHLAKMPLEERDKWINSKFTFVTMNSSNMLKQMQNIKQNLDNNLNNLLKMHTLDGKLLIIDEAHNFFRAITNGSANALGAYKMIMESKVRLLFLTGTPIANDPFELVPCFNMLSGENLLPTDYDEFHKLFVERDTILNKNKLQNRLFGLVSSLPISYIESDLPEELELKTMAVNMTPKQYSFYQLAREAEKEEVQRGGVKSGNAALTKPKSQRSSTYRVKSRQLSNVCLEDTIESPKFEAIYKNLLKHKYPGLVYSQFKGPGGIESFKKYLELKNWSEWKNETNIHVGGFYSSALPSTDEIFQQVIGAGPEGTDKDNDTEEVTSLSDIYKKDSSTLVPKNKFAIITGDVDFALRELIKNVISSEENKTGDIIRVVLCSSSAAEGYDFKNLTHIHLMEPQWGRHKERQVKARGVRTGSLKYLPEADRKVQPYIYLAIPPQSEETAPTTDTEMFEESGKKDHLNMQFVAALDEIAIECKLYKGKDCRVCMPTDKPLYTKDILYDIKQVDPCSELKEETVLADSIEHNGVEYFYIPFNNIYDYKLFLFDKKLNSYVAVPQDKDFYFDVTEKIKNLKK